MARVKQNKGRRRRMCSDEERKGKRSETVTRQREREKGGGMHTIGLRDMAGRQRVDMM